MWIKGGFQRHLKAVEASYKYEKGRAKKLRSDAALDGRIMESQYFLIEDAIGEAFRAGAIHALLAKQPDEATV